MRFILIHSMMQSSRKFRNRLLYNLQPPPADNPLPRKDHTGFVLVLLVVSLAIAGYLMY